MNASLKALLNEQYKLVAELREENKKLKEKLSEITMVADDEKQSIEHILELEEQNKKLKDDVDFYYKSAKQFREDAESWRKECERLLGLQLCGKTIAERIEDDKKVLRE